MVDRKGDVVDGDQLLFVIADSLHKQGRLKGGVVGTLMSNFGMEKALEERNIPFVRANVGDRYVMQELKARDWVIGGESSGHIICLDKTTTGDGLVSALQVLTQMQFMGKSGTGRVLLRPSGTEPVIRVMVEGRDEALVQSVCENVSQAVNDQL